MAFNSNTITLLFSLVCWLHLSTVRAQNQGIDNLDGTHAVAFAQHIRTNHNMSKAIYLTRIADQLSLSFASQAQMQSHWQQALNETIETPLNLSQLDTHALMAQILIRYTHGMNLNRWRMADLSPFKPLPRLSEHMSVTQKFNAWLNLHHYWQDILDRFASQGSTAWLSISELPKTSAQQPSAQQLTKTLTFINNLSKKESGNDSALTSLLMNFSQKWSLWPPLPALLLRQSWHRHHEQWLAWAYDWIEIYQHIELSNHLLTAQEQQTLSEHIQTSQNLWLINRSIVEARDDDLYELIEDIFKQLPVKFKSPDHLDASINDRILTLATGIKDPEDYFYQPLRDQLQENLEVCLNLSTFQAPNPEEPIADHQFTSCLNEFIDWAQFAAFDSGLAGQPIPLDSTISLSRVLDLSSPQIINYLSAQAAQNQECIAQLSPQPNPVEWLLAVESLNWLHDRWPGIMAVKQPLAEDVQAIINTGLTAYQYPDCLQINTVLSDQFMQLEQKWSTLKQSIRLYIKDYRDKHLAQGSDIDFFQDTDQLTDAVPDNLMIPACDVKSACGAFIQLKPDNKVLQLFPNHLKIAQQFQLGDVSICYNQVQWQERKSLPSQLNNNKISNYEGQLSINLVGKFRDSVVFEQTLETTERYVYLFGENSQDVLDMSCPLPIVGQQITTSIDRGTFGLLPNRLTFLTALKVDVNNIIKQQWQQWQNNLDPTKVNLVNGMDDIKPLVNEAFIKHTNDVQQQIYRKLTTSNPSRINDSALSNSIFDYLTERQSLVATVRGLFPGTFHKDMAIRSALTGIHALPDEAFFKHAYDTQLNLMDMMDRGDAIIDQHKPTWFNQDRHNKNDFLLPSLMQFYKRFSTHQNVDPTTDNTIDTVDS